MATAKLNRKRALVWRVLFTTALVAVSAYVLAAHWHIVTKSLTLAREAQPIWLACSVLLMMLTFCIAAGIYGVLALHPVRYVQTLLVEVAAAFVGRLLPAGLGGLGLNGVYLFRRKHTPAEATAVVSVNNLLGMGAHLVLLAGVLVGQPYVIGKLFAGHHIVFSLTELVIIIAAVALVCAVPIIRARLLSFGSNLLVSVRKEGARKILRALLLAALLTLTYTSLLFCTARSINIGLSVVQLFIVFSFGMLAGTVTPTPGGLVGAEAGLYAGFVSYGIPGPQAGAAVLLFRLVTYWLPLIPGAFALISARSRRLV